jgi:hypothetical protein
MAKEDSMGEDVEGWPSSNSTGHAADYAAKGRKHQHLTDDELTAAWVAEFDKYIAETVASIEKIERENPAKFDQLSREIEDELIDYKASRPRHRSRANFRRPQCLSFRAGSNTRPTFRFNTRMTPMRANIVGPLFPATRIRASIAACHSSALCSALDSLVM